MTDFNTFMDDSTAERIIVVFIIYRIFLQQKY